MSWTCRFCLFIWNKGMSGVTLLFECDSRQTWCPALLLIFSSWMASLICFRVVILGLHVIGWFGGFIFIKEWLILFLTGNDKRGYVKNPLFPASNSIVPLDSIVSISEDTGASWAFDIFTSQFYDGLPLVALDQNIRDTSSPWPAWMVLRWCLTICSQALLISPSLEEMPNLVFEVFFILSFDENHMVLEVILPIFGTHILFKQVF